MLVTSRFECSRHCRANKKTRILISTVLEVEIGPKVTTSGRRRNFVAAKLDLGGGDMKVSTINISSVKFHTTEYLRPDTVGDGGERAASSTTTTNRGTTITCQVLIRFFEAPSPETLND